MRIARASRRRSVGTNTTPMVDMAFLLITFFVMTLRLGMFHERTVELPRADQARTTHEARLTVVTLTIDRVGRVLWAGSEKSLPTLERELQARLAEGEKLKVVLRADARSPFDRVRGVMRSAAEAGVEKISVSALKLGESGR